MTDVPREEWREVLDSLSRSHHGWLVTLEVTDGGAPRVQGRELPLAGMEVEGDRPGQRGPGGELGSISASELVGRGDAHLSFCARLS